MTDRRDFLKLFGAGAAIVPLVNGIMVPEARARVIVPPKVELFGAVPKSEALGMRELMSSSMLFSGKFEMSVELRDKDSGAVYRTSQDSYITQCTLNPRHETVEFYGRAVEFYDRMGWKIEGVYAGERRF